MILNLIGQINIIKAMNFKPNYSELAREYGIDRRTVKAVYEYLIDKECNIGSYSNFLKYVKSKEIKVSKKVKGYPRYETPPGKQAQVDWKENLKLTSKNNEEYIINVFNYKLGNSRYCNFEYRKNKTQQDVFECLISSFKANRRY